MPGVQAGEVLAEGPVGRDVAQHGLPGVAVGVDEAWKHIVVSRVDDFGSGGVDVGADRGDDAILDQDIGALEVARLRIDGEYRPMLDEDRSRPAILRHADLSFCHRHPDPFLVDTGARRGPVGRLLCDRVMKGAPRRGRVVCEHVHNK